MAPQAHAIAPLYNVSFKERLQGPPTLMCKWQPGGVEAGKSQVRRGGVWQTEAQAVDALRFRCPKQTSIAPKIDTVPSSSSSAACTLAPSKKNPGRSCRHMFAGENARNDNNKL
jgi:hypothetical protein